MTEQEKQPTFTDLRDLLAHAYAIEVDAIDRYNLLADQMEVANSDELAALFRKLASHEEHHAREILERAGDMELPQLKLSEQKWTDAESPEAAAMEDAHYLMTPWHALQMALKAEQRAFDFFDRIVNTTTDNDVRKWAEEFREEEAEHVRLVEDLLKRYPAPDPDWDHDDDPPVILE